MFPIQPSPGKQAASARTVSSETAVFVLRHEARHALRRRFGLEDSQLDHALGLLGAERVEGPEGPVEQEAAELITRLREGRLPWFIHACPRWRRDVLRRMPSLQPCFSLPRPVPCVAVVSCAARKADFAGEGWAGALTVREAALGLMKNGMRPVRDACRPSGGPAWLERVIQRAHRLAGESGASLPSFSPAGEFAGVETARFTLLGRELRAARVRGAAEMERLLRLFTPQGLPWELIEVLVCAGGCERG